MRRTKSLRHVDIEGESSRVSSREEAEIAELWRKSHLRELYLSEPWALFKQEDTISNDDVLEGLGPPHSNLQVLKISLYDGLKLPTWLDDLPFSNLFQLRLYYYRNCKELPGLGMLPMRELVQEG
ncbi:hypothetical protein ACLOJK_029635 [Asimina triloba]